MSLKVKSKKHNDNNIWEHDLFDRQEVAKDFTKIIKKVDQSFVLSVDAPYGSGKSFFLSRWYKEMSKENCTVFFNAWSFDYLSKPLVPFMYELLSQLDYQKLIKHNIKDDAKNAKDAVGSLLKEAIKNKSGIDIDLLLSFDSLKVFGQNTALLEKHESLKNSISAFKKYIQEIIEKSKYEKIYVFVDELERCRPSFSIELLESIKHLFDIEGLVFILAIDRSQLKSAVSTIYGHDMDGDGYLRRFIDLELYLPEPEVKPFIEMLCNELDINNNDINLAQTWRCGFSEFNRFFLFFTKIYAFSLREIEQVYTEIKLISIMLDENESKFMPLLAFVISAKYKDRRIYNLLMNDRNIHGVVDYIKKELCINLKKDDIFTRDLVIAFIYMTLGKNKLKGVLDISAEKKKDLIKEGKSTSELEKELSFYEEAYSYYKSFWGDFDIISSLKNKMRYTLS